MNRTTRRLRNRADLERDVEALTAARDSLLDVLNVLLTIQGGRAVVPSVMVQASTRRPIHVTQVEDRYVIELEGYEPPKSAGLGVRDRLRRIGMRPV